MNTLSKEIIEFRSSGDYLDKTDKTADSFNPEGEIVV